MYLEPPEPCDIVMYWIDPDYNHDGSVDGADVEAFFSDWSDGISYADLDGNYVCDACDVAQFFKAWEGG